jgi:hypothetical protein
VCLSFFRREARNDLSLSRTSKRTKRRLRRLPLDGTRANQAVMEYTGFELHLERANGASIVSHRFLQEVLIAFSLWIEYEQWLTVVNSHSWRIHMASKL